MINEKDLRRELERRCTHNEVCVTSEKFTLKELVYIIETFPKVTSKFPPEIGQILKNQIVIMGMLQDMQEEIEEIPNIAETHKLLTETKKYGPSDNV